MIKKISNQFLSSYLFVFLLTTMVTTLAVVLLSFASGLIEGRLVKERYPARAIIKEDYTQIDASAVVKNGGGVQVVNKDYQVVYSEGLDTIGKSQLSAEEFTAFLMESSDQPYHYDIVYQPQGEYWLIVTFPTSIRLSFSVVHNPAAVPDDMAMASKVIAAISLIYLTILALLASGYSRFMAAQITEPLHQLSEGTRLLRAGDYSARVDLKLKNEFANLQETFNDMAARIEQEMTLRKKSENDRRRLILDISHDLKNPLASIQGYTELCMKKKDLSEQERREYLQAIYQNSHRANLLLADLFELSQMDSPQFLLKPVEIEVCEYLRQICGALIPPLEQAGFQYEFDIPEKNIPVRLDPPRFSRIFQNLTDNAVRYNRPGTVISVSLREEKADVVICFADDGCGIPNHLVEDIFKPFVRVDDARNSKTGGSGLGLAIAKKIARAHQGDLTLDIKYNNGSAFMIRIPKI
ncbi:HAMP domain-containing histidine kinase [Acetobacterium wieringae]|uniref:histidine kinase n=1 Tax=Acetobacterium wieringae TaxID=52694 RepID=A0A1F2PHH9_9FIRM|nr:HAMP domain-containing sensor histidine kinase [Acetobacterium wieringae]OFV70788.1 signal transduction histidine-protein kinase ArlS [Acetobacterium wieringae]UYO62690.1 HAMP domain-containing histidine kinase [Acetobacterium wieringae]VUZ25005.1 Adaptive-response sensory-kinase SasA [Acetobacterium wieringae]